VTCAKASRGDGRECDERGSHQTERGKHRKSDGDRDGDGERSASDPAAGERLMGRDAQEPSLGGDVEQRTAAKEEPDGE
jgi:hypothetical protein